MQEAILRIVLNGMNSEADRTERAPDPTSSLENGTLLGDRFRTTGVLGIGGFGITYHAVDEVLEMEVAVKEYMPNGIAIRDDDSGAVQPASAGHVEDFDAGLRRFLEEARRLARFEQHPNIVRVRTFFEENGTSYLVMNYYEGQTLAETLRAQNGFLSESKGLRIAQAVLDGLSTVHQAAGS